MAGEAGEPAPRPASERGRAGAGGTAIVGAVLLAGLGPSVFPVMGRPARPAPAGACRAFGDGVPVRGEDQA